MIASCLGINVDCSIVANSYPDIDIVCACLFSCFYIWVVYITPSVPLNIFNNFVDSYSNFLLTLDGTFLLLVTLMHILLTGLVKQSLNSFLMSKC